MAQKTVFIFFIAVVFICNAISLSQTKSATELFEHANKNYESKDYQAAIADFTDAISLQPSYAEAYCGRGLAKYCLSDYQGAIADYTKAINLKPDFAEAYSNRGNAKGHLDDWQ
ncbi:MAG: tetratricopeptide repeat protein, partial [Bacteroidota bacterium]